jgi:hypothetical protein
LPTFDRYDIFRYTLASYAAIDRWSKCIFYIQLDQDYQGKRDELEAYIHGLFGAEKCSIRWHRNVYTRDWREAAEEVLALSDDPIWLTCNDDHVFIDYDRDMVDEVVGLMNADPDKRTTCYFSHWPEVIRVAAREGEGLMGRFVPMRWNVHDSIQIVSKEVFRTYWFDYDFGDKSVSRTDVIHDYTEPKMEVRCYVPTRELCRHFDGYSHVADLRHVAPPLTIPPGFFERDIRILYCSGERRDGWVNMNPMASDYFAADPFGTDYKWMLEDVPLVWAGRVSEVESKKRVDRDRLCHARNEAKWASSKSVTSCFCRGALPLPPDEWFEPHKRS